MWSSQFESISQKTFDQPRLPKKERAKTTDCLGSTPTSRMIMEKKANLAKSKHQLSVVIPVYNSERTIENCLNSVIKAFPTKKEIIVIDDASTDNSPNIVSRFPVKLFCCTNRSGPAKARNLGIEHSTSQIIAFVDSDCSLEKHSLETLIRVLTENDTEDIGGVGGVAEPLKKTLISDSYSVRLFGTSLVEETGIREIDSIGSAFAVYFKKVLIDVGGFDENLRGGEDYDLNLRIRKAGYKLLLEPSAVAQHDHPTSLLKLAKKWFFYGLAFFGVCKKNRLKREIIQMLGWVFSCVLLFFILLWSKEFLFLPLLVFTFWIPWALYYSVLTVKFWIRMKRIRYLALPLVHHLIILSYALGFLSAIFKIVLRIPSRSHTGWER